MSLLTVTDLRVSLGGKPILRGPSFEIAAGEFVGLIGPNGAGKSTLLRAVLGLVPSEGRIAIADRGAESMDPGERARNIAYLPQERDIAWPVPVEMIVSLGRAPHRPSFAGLTVRDREIIDNAMRRMDVEALRARPATELSGGEKARVLIARALAQDAPLLLADEPAAGLDPAHQIALMKVFRGLAQEGSAVVASMHDLGIAARWCSRLILVDHGAVIADASPREVLVPDLLRAVYGVEAYVGDLAGGLVVQPLDIIAPDSAAKP